MQDYQQNATVKSHVEVVITRRQLCRWLGEEVSDKEVGERLK